MRLPDPARSRIVLIGASRFSDDGLSDLPTVRVIIDDLALAFTDPAHELSPFEEQPCVALTDEGDPREIGRCIESASAEAEELLLFYYAGHGLVNQRRRDLYLALPDSSPTRPGFNSLAYADIQEAVLDSKAATKVVVLDCDLPEDEIGDLGVEGASVLTAAHNREFPRQLLRVLAEAGAGVDRVARQMLDAVDRPDQVDPWMVEWLRANADVLIGRAPQVASELLDLAAANVPFGTEEYAWLTSRLAQALFFTGDLEQCQQIAKLTLECSTDPDLLVNVHSTLAQCLGISGSAEDATKTLDLVLESSNLSARHRARLLVPAARTHFHLGDFEMAGKVATDALAAASEADDTWAEGWSLAVIASSLLVQGQTVDGLAMFDRASVVAASDATLTDLQLLIQVNQAASLGNLGRYDEALQVATEVCATADQYGSAVRIAQAYSGVNTLRFEMGQWDDALTGILKLAEDLQEPAAMCNDLGTAAFIYFHRDATEAARRSIAAARPHAENLGRRFIAHWALAQSLEQELSGDQTAALATLMVGLNADTEEHGEIDFVLPDAVRLAVATGDKESADRLREHAAGLADGSEIPHRLGNDLYCRGLIDSDPERLVASAIKYEDARRPLYAAMAYEAAADLLLARDEEKTRKRGREALIRAADAYELLGATADTGRLRAVFRQHGIRRGSQSQSQRSKSGRTAGGRPLTGWESLTPMEEKVAALVSEGLSNPEAGERLGMSRRTVGTHVSHILKKLQVASRADIARESALRTAETSDT